MSVRRGRTNKQVAADLGVDESTPDRRRARFIACRLDGQHDELRLGRPPSILLDQVEDVVVATMESVLGNIVLAASASRAGTAWTDHGTAPRNAA